MVGSFIHAPGFDSRLVQVDPGRRELGVIHWHSWACLNSAAILAWAWPSQSHMETKLASSLNTIMRKELRPDFKTLNLPATVLHDLQTQNVPDRQQVW